MFLGFSDVLLISFLALWCNLVTYLRLVPPLSLNSPGLLLYQFIIDFAEVTVMSQRVSFAQGSSIPWHLITLNWRSGVLRKSWDWQQKQDIQASKTRNRKSNVSSQTAGFGWMAWGQLLQAFTIVEGWTSRAVWLLFLVCLAQQLACLSSAWSTSGAGQLFVAGAVPRVVECSPAFLASMCRCQLHTLPPVVTAKHGCKHCQISRGGGNMDSCWER